MKSDMTAEQIAAAFHEAYERLAPSHGYETREASAKPWDEVPENNRRLMSATVADLIGRGVISPGLPTTATRQVVDGEAVRAALKVLRLRYEQLRTAVIAARELAKITSQVLAEFDLGDGGVTQILGTDLAARMAGLDRAVQYWRDTYDRLADPPLAVEVEEDDDEDREPTEGAFSVREEERVTRVYLRTDGSLEREVGTIGAPEDLPTLLHLVADEMSRAPQA
jgi:hypothetical protein